MEIKMTKGNYKELGAAAGKNQICFTFACEKEKECKLVLLHKPSGEREELIIPKEYCRGALYSVNIEGILAKNYLYQFVIDNKVVLDPYAKVIAGREVWNDPERSTKEENLWAGFLADKFDWGEDKNPEVPKSEMVMYKLHARGYTMAAKGRNKGSFAALTKQISYWKDLGLTTIELMPVYEFEEKPQVKPLPQVPDYVKWEEKAANRIQPVVLETKEKPINYWGYGEGNYFALKASYASRPEHAPEEFKNFIRELHENHMECVMEISFPEETDPSMILEVLRFWVAEYHVDGFHLLGGRLPIDAILKDAFLARTKIFAEDFFGKTTGRSYKNLYIYKEEYHFSARQLLNAYPCDVAEFMNQQKKQGEAYGYVNFLASNNGFTLADVFMYNDKHNEANGENNTDGSDYNFSNNCSVEGLSKKKHVLALRRSRIRAAYMMLLLGQGIPLLMAGDEFGNSQAGNNNAYCQDNEIGWTDWSNFSKTKEDRELLKALIAFRKSHSLISNELPFRFNDYRAYGAPDLSYHGEHAWISQIDHGRKCIGLLYNGAYAKEEGAADIYVAYNFYSEAVKLALPQILTKGQKKKKAWYQIMTSDIEAGASQEEKLLEEQQFVQVPPQSVTLLIGK